VAVFSDTVGFIRKLPHHLVASFKSTLEEIALAGVVLHIVDRSHAGWEEQMEVGREVLADIGVDGRRILTVFNKADLVNGQPLQDQDPNGADAVWVSALTGDGLDDLKTAIRGRIDD
jgi:GTP-binding protein HflX